MEVLCGVEGEIRRWRGREEGDVKLDESFLSKIELTCWTDLRVVLLSLRICKLVFQSVSSPNPSPTLKSLSATLIQSHYPNLITLLSSPDTLLAQTALSVLQEACLHSDISSPQGPLCITLLKDLLSSDNEHFVRNTLELLSRILKVASKFQRDDEGSEESFGVISEGINILTHVHLELLGLAQKIERRNCASEVLEFVSLVCRMIKFGIQTEKREDPFKLTAATSEHWRNITTILPMLGQLCQKQVHFRDVMGRKLLKLVYIISETLPNEPGQIPLCYSLLMSSLESFQGDQSALPVQYVFLNLASIVESVLMHFDTFHNTPFLNQLYSAFHSHISKFNPKSLISSFFQIYQEQDDLLISMMQKLLNIFKFLHKDTIRWKIDTSFHSFFESTFSPHIIFDEFLSVVSYDHMVLLDFLISTETSFLEYFLNYLTFLKSDYTQFVKTLEHQDGNTLLQLSHSIQQFSMEVIIQGDEEIKPETEVDVVITTLIRLKFSMEKLIEQKLFPYNASPLLHKIGAIEDLYEKEDEVLLHENISLVNY
eukprot:TRINITY_DN1960_c0_g1_i1.p1 TRINITY_DN1960_c0_g1~~TRINITY_DN1960_c0_g1_i1.p1  ORF type:complete len:556 (+),score=151.48 TRINITY_DN1960_c0_g1_i1:47-1669(+)